MIRVLFVCLGNICRSPMAEAVFASKVREADLESEIEVDSAGTGDYHIGKPPHRGTQKALADRDIPLDHLARQVDVDDLNRFDYVVVMDEMNWRDVLALGEGRAQVRRLLEFDPGKTLLEVPDPYHSGAFESVFELIDRACDGLLAEIRRELDKRARAAEVAGTPAI